MTPPLDRFLKTQLLLKIKGIFWVWILRRLF